MRELSKIERRPIPIVFYFENSPDPIRYVAPDPDNKELAKIEDRSYKYLERQIKLNAVSQQSRPSLGSIIGPIFDRISGVISISNAITLLVVFSIVYAILTEVLRWF